MSFPLPLRLQRILSSLVKRDCTKFAAKFRLEVLLVKTFANSRKDIHPPSKELSSKLGTSVTSTSDDTCGLLWPLREILCEMEIFRSVAPDRPRKQNF